MHKLRNKFQKSTLSFLSQKRWKQATNASGSAI